MSSITLSSNVAATGPEDLSGNTLVRALMLSAFAHLVFLAFMRAPQEHPTEKLVRVSLVPVSNRDQPPPQTQKPERQIVAPSQAKEEPPPEETTRESERDARTVKEQKRLGEEKPPPPPQQKASVKAIEQSRPARPDPPNKPPPAKAELRLNNRELLTALADPASQRTAPPPSKSLSLQELENRALADNGKGQSASKLQNYVPFNRNTLSAAFSQTPGTHDYLPNVPDGEITLLNAKANKFAVFVRRVALQVFGQLRTSSWSRLPYAEVVRLNEFATVEAVMSREGKLLRVVLNESSGSLAFDKILKDSANSGAWDQNPPAGVIAEDGNIHFVFQAKTWARGAQDGITEQRWLLLGTGLL